MRIPKFISPSALSRFEKNLDEYYLNYLAENRPPRTPQTKPMAVGSAFDAFVKSYLHNALHGNYGDNNEYSKDAIFESQVEEHNRDWAKEAGQHVFQRYCRSGALSDLMKELDTAIGPPRFEFDLHGKVNGIPLLGKPDIYFTNEHGARVVFDWKVNGYCSKSAVSPAKGYIKVRDTWTSLERRASRYNGVSHKDCVTQEYLGLRINCAQNLEDCYSQWADQLSIYAWLLGEEVGSEELIIGIDQVVALEADSTGKPFLRVANHRSKVSREYQTALLTRLQRLWSAITSGHIFGHLTREQNDKRCAELEEMAVALSQTDAFSQFVNEESRW